MIKFEHKPSDNKHDNAVTDLAKHIHWIVEEIGWQEAIGIVLDVFAGTHADLGCPMCTDIHSDTDHQFFAWNAMGLDLKAICAQAIIKALTEEPSEE